MNNEFDELDRVTIPFNTNDPRVLRRILKVIDWSNNIIASERRQELAGRSVETPIPKNEIVSILSTNPLGLWLRHHLLVETRGYYVGSRCKSYRVNREFRTNLIRTFEQPVVTAAIDTIKDELAGRTDFTYTHVEQDGRIYHPVQNYPGYVKNQIFDGWYNYDMNTAHPSIITQLYHQLTGFKLDGMEAYVLRRTQHRERLANLLEIDTTTVKRLLTGLVYGMRLSRSPKSTLGATLLALDKSQTDIAMFIDDPLVQEIKSDLKVAKKALEEHHSNPLWMICNIYERRAWNAVTDKWSSVQKFNEHDGFRSKEWIEPEAVTQVVHDSTGIQVSYSCDRDAPVLT